MNRRLFLLASLALGGCATMPPPVAAPPTPPAAPPATPTAAPPAAPTPLAELEPLYSAVAGRDGLTIRVASNGCTAKADFAFYLERRGETVAIAFARKRVDVCRSFAMGKAEIAFTWAELGVEPRAPLFLLNPVTAWTGPGS